MEIVSSVCVYRKFLLQYTSITIIIIAIATQVGVLGVLGSRGFSNHLGIPRNSYESSKK
jgi:hypothetical protein